MGLGGMVLTDPKKAALTAFPTPTPPAPTINYHPTATPAPAPITPPTPTTSPTSSTPTTTNNFAAPDKDLTDMVAAYKKRLLELQQRPAVDPTYTTRAVANARGEIMGGAAGAQEGASARLAAMGRTGGGGETGMRSRIAETAQRAANKAASDISLARQRDEEQQAQTRDQMENAFLLGGADITQAPSRLALSQQGLGLQQMLGAGNLDLARQNQAWQQQYGNAQLSLEDKRLNQQTNQDQISTLLALSRMYPDAYSVPGMGAPGGGYVPDYDQHF